MPRQFNDRECLRFCGAGVGGEVPPWPESSSLQARQALPSSIRGSLATWRATRFARSWRSRQPKDCISRSGKYAPIRRTGFLTASSDGFRAQNGRKALTSMDAHGITATFNPLGVFLRRWQLDGVHIQSGEVGIQTYEPKPEPSPSKPWYHIFLPNRVYLQRVWSEPADVTWRFRNEKGGFFGTRLLITPHGRDFEYQANGGTMKLALIPDLPLRHTHLLITKKLLTLYTLDLAAGPESDGVIHARRNGRDGRGQERRFQGEIRQAADPRMAARELEGSCRGGGGGKRSLAREESEAGGGVGAGFASGAGRARSQPPVSAKAGVDHREEIDRRAGAE